MVPACLALLAVLAGAPQGAEPGAKDAAPEELLRYQVSGGLSGYKTLDVVVYSDGLGHVTAHRKELQTSRIQLNSAELDALKSTVRTSHFFTLPAIIPARGTDSSVSTLSVRMDGRRHEVRCLDSSRLGELSRFVWRILEQELLIHDLRTRPDEVLLRVESSVDRFSASTKVLQPRVIREPLEEALRRTNSDRLFWGARALAFVTTPIEYQGFFAAELERTPDPRRSALLAIAGNTEFEEHREGIAPLLLHHLQQGRQNWARLTPEQRKAYEAVIERLGEARYRDAAPILITLLRELPSEQVPGLTFALARICVGAPHVIELLLAEPKPGVRRDATQILASIARLTRERPAEERPRYRDSIEQLRRFSASAVPKLSALAESDPDPEVRAAARDAAARITAEMPEAER